MEDVSWIFEDGGTIIAETPNGKTRYPEEAVAFIARLSKLGVNKSVLERTFLYKGVTYKILGYSPYEGYGYGIKGPIIISVDGMIEKCTVEFMQNIVYETNPEMAL